MTVRVGALDARRGCTRPSHRNTALVKNAAVIRGPMLGNRDSGYCYLAGTVNLNNNTTTLPGSLRNQNQSNAKRMIRVTVSPDEFPTVTVEIDFTGTGNSYQTVLSYRMTTAAPLTWKFGFAASTGGGNDVHLVRTPKIQTVDPLPPGINLVKQVDRTQQQPPSYTAGDTVPYQFVVTNTSVPPLSNVAVTDPKVTNISCPSTSLGAAGTATASMTCTGSHRLTATETATTTSFTNTATATGMSSGQTVSSESSVTVPLTAKPQIAIQKSATLNDTVTANNAADVGETIDYSFLVTNAGNVPLTLRGGDGLQAGHGELSRNHSGAAGDDHLYRQVHGHPGRRRRRDRAQQRDLARHPARRQPGREPALDGGRPDRHGQTRHHPDQDADPARPGRRHAGNRRRGRTHQLLVRRPPTPAT